MYKIDFLNKLNEEISDKSEAALKDFIIKLAKQLPSSSYAEILSWFSPAEVSVEDVGNRVDALGARVDALNTEIENGVYGFYWSFSDSYDWDYDYDDYGDESDNELIDENGLGKELDALFQGVVDLVYHGEYGDASQLFEKLFAIEIDDEYDTILTETLFANDILRTPYTEVLYTHAYSVLMTQQGNNRVSRFFEIINSDWYSVKNFKLDDVLRAGGKPLPDEATFYQEWIQYLMGLPSDRKVCERDVFLLDALTHSGGIGALEKFVSENGMNFPKMCFKLIDLYMESERYDDAVVIIYDGFEGLKGVNSNKRILADYLITLAEVVDNQEHFKVGIVEAFQATLDFKYFVEIFRLGDKGLIDEAVGYLRLKKGEASEVAYYAIEFLIGNYQLVWTRCAKDKEALGWSSYSFKFSTDSSLKGSLFPLFLALLSEGKLGEVTGRLVKEKFQYEGFEALLLQSFRALTAEEYQQYFKWCKDEIEKRVVAIVGNKHRKSYYKASALIVAMAEVLMIDVNEATAMSYVKRFKEMFPRHNSFTKCLKADLALIGKML